MSEEYNKRQLIRYLQQRSVDGKVSIEDLSNLVFDANFPENLFAKAKEQLIQTLLDQKRYKELAEIMVVKTGQLMKLQKEIISLSKNKLDNLLEINRLKKQQKMLEIEMKPLDEEFEILTSKFKEMKGEL